MNKCTLHARMNIELLNLLKLPQGDYGRKKKNTGDEPIRVIIHTYMEISTRKFPV
jgi:hypothetical protein